MEGGTLCNRKTTIHACSCLERAVHIFSRLLEAVPLPQDSGPAQSCPAPTNQEGMSVYVCGGDATTHSSSLNSAGLEGLTRL